MKQRRVPWPLVALTSLSIAWLASHTSLGNRLEHSLADASAAWLQHEIESDVVIVGIDARSLSELNEWPWPRRRHAALLKKLAEAPPRRLFMDIDFSADTSVYDDERLAAALALWDGEPIILPAFYQYASASSKELVLTQPLDILRPHAAVASVNMEPAADGLVRGVRSAWSVHGQVLPAAASLLAGTTPQPGTEIRIDFTIDPASFRVLSYSDIVNNRTPAEYYADKIVLVGATAIELGDIVPVPVYQSLPGVVVQALAYESARLSKLASPPAGLYWGIVAIWSLLLAYCFCHQTWQRNVLVAVASIASVVGAFLILYSKVALVIEIVPLSLTAVIAYLLATLRSLETETLRAIMYAIGYRKRDALLKSIVLSSTDCIVCIDASGEVQTANPAATSLFACGTGELIGASIFSFIPTLKSADEADQQLTLDISSGSLLECAARTTNGNEFPVELSVSRVRLRDEVLYTAIVRDISERKAQQRQLQFQATHDPLTTLPNRPALAAHLDARLGDNDASRGIALLMIDLDRFKEVNDTLGHNVGDHVLHEVARRLAAVAEDRGFLARIGGDEFALVVDRYPGKATITRLSQDLAECLKHPVETSGIGIEVGMSIGIALYPDDAADAETLFKYSDVAMYSAKRNGADFEFYDSANDGHTIRKLTIVSRLRAAISNDELELHYQPQVNLRSGCVESVEALLRWRDSALGDVRPDEFIELAEATDLIQPLSNWTLCCALQQVVEWRTQGLKLRVAVNISARVLQDVGFPARIANLLRDASVAPEEIELEITESAMMIDPNRAQQVIQKLGELGFLVSVDDFGTGYSSLAYLRDLPVHALKLDKSFIQNMRQQQENRVIVESTVQMAHALGLDVVAEGVETESDARILVNCGYDFGQGYLYSAALKPAALKDWLKKFNASGGAIPPPELAQIV